MRAANEEERVQMALKITNTCHTPRGPVGAYLTGLASTQRFVLFLGLTLLSGTVVRLYEKARKAFLHC